jgi:hypothetical protein
MGSPLSSVFDLFLQTISDYRLIELFNTSESDFENFLEAWLIFSINDFNICDQSLVFDSTTKEFSETLTPENMVILAMLMMKYWTQKNVNDVTQFNLHVVDRDFKVSSEAQNLKTKIAHLNNIKEECSQLLNNYGFKKVDWALWLNQEFSGL